MSSTWRSAGLNYVNYSLIAARTLRRSLKASPEKDAAAKRDQSSIKFFYWEKGEMLPAGQKPSAAKAAEKEKTAA